MEPKDYVVKKIEGEYATLSDIRTGEELFIALALLPPRHIHAELQEQSTTVRYKAE